MRARFCVVAEWNLPARPCNCYLPENRPREAAIPPGQESSRPKPLISRWWQSQTTSCLDWIGQQPKGVPGPSVTPMTPHAGDLSPVLSHRLRDGHADSGASPDRHGGVQAGNASVSINRVGEHWAALITWPPGHHPGVRRLHCQRCGRGRGVALLPRPMPGHACGRFVEAENRLRAEGDHMPLKLRKGYRTDSQTRRVIMHRKNALFTGRNPEPGLGTCS